MRGTRKIHYNKKSDTEIKKDSWNKKWQNVNSFFAYIFVMEEFHEIANLTFPSRGPIPEKLLKMECQQNILERNQQKE